MEGIEGLANEVDVVLMSAQVFTVTTTEEAQDAKDYIKNTIKSRRKKIKDKFDPICDAANVAHNTATSARKSLLDPLDKAENIIKTAIGNYLIEQAAIAEKAAAAAEEKARKERIKALDLAGKRLAKLLEKGGELQSQIHILTEQLEDDTIDLTDADRETIENRLNILKHKKEEADRAVEAKKEEVETIPYTPSPVAAAPPKIEGMNTRFTKKPEVISLMLLAKAVVSGQIPISVLLPNMPQIQKLVDADQKLPGITVHKKTITTIR